MRQSKLWEVCGNPGRVVVPADGYDLNCNGDEQVLDFNFKHLILGKITDDVTFNISNDNPFSLDCRASE